MGNTKLSTERQFQIKDLWGKFKNDNKEDESVLNG